MRGLDEIFKSARQIYDGRVRGSTPESIISDCLIKIQDITQYCLVKLAGRDVSSFDVAHTGGKRYCILESNGQLSRPILKSLFEFQPEAAVANLQALFNSKSPATRSYTLSGEATAKALYSAVMSFSVCYDLWKPSSRKTPGTYFELVLGSLLAAVLPGHKRLKHIPLAGLEDDPSNESVSTDIVFQKGTQQSGLVIPAKITTRERIVQVYAHQRILDSVYPGAYKTALMAVSETQRQERGGVNDICVPGTLKLFQRHLAPISGIYYLDPPARYLSQDLTSIVKVSDVQTLLREDLVVLTA